MVDINIFKLKQLASLNNYQFSEENGQIIYGPPMNTNVVPPKNSEVFIGRLPQDIDNTLVVKRFSEVATIYTFRVMQNFSGLNRGFAFVQFLTCEDAEKAIKFLNNYEIRPGETIAVTKSRNNCRLYIGRLDTSLGYDRIFEFFDNLTCDLVNLELYSSQQYADGGFGYGFLEYKTHKDAAKARRVLKPCKLKLGNRQFCVDWANTNVDYDSRQPNQLDDQSYHAKINNYSLLPSNNLNNGSLSSIQVDDQTHSSVQTNSRSSFQSNNSNLKYASSPEINANQSYSDVVKRVMTDFTRMKKSPTSWLSLQEQINRMKISENAIDQENVCANNPYDQANFCGNSQYDQENICCSRPYDQANVCGSRPYDYLSSTPIKPKNFQNDEFVLICTNVRESAPFNEICRVFTLDQQMRIQKIRRVHNCIFIHYASSLVANLMLKTFQDIKDEFTLYFGEFNKVCELMDERSYADLNSTFFE